MLGGTTTPGSSLLGGISWATLGEEAHHVVAPGDLMSEKNQSSRSRNALQRKAPGAGLARVIMCEPVQSKLLGSCV